LTERKKVVGIIPARLGSLRVKAKALRLINGKPMIAYAIRSLLSANTVDQCYVNSESEIIGKVAREYGISFYHRDSDLASDSSLIDDYLYDFIVNVECDVLVVVNPTSPFITAEEIDACVDNFLASDCQTQLACEAIRTHCFVDGTPINFSTAGQHPRSQDLSPVQALNFAVTIWDAHAFRKQYEDVGHGVYTGKLGFYNFTGLSTIDVDWEEDFVLADTIMRNLDSMEGHTADYHPLVVDKVRNESGSGQEQ
jgi:CMP-N,N'-diacetyllegionaminic acid synthase